MFLSSDDIDYKYCRNGDPDEIKTKKDDQYDEIDRTADHDPCRTKNNTQNSSYDAVILIQRLEKMPERDTNGKRLVHFFKRGNKRMCDGPRTVDIPMVEKIEKPVKKPLDNIDESKIH
jgi:hypothetical protein